MRLALLLLLFAAPALAQPPGVDPNAHRVTFTYSMWSDSAGTGRPWVGVPANVRRWEIQYSADGGPWKPWFGGRSNVPKDGTAWTGLWTWDSGYRNSMGIRARIGDQATPTNWTGWAYTSWWRP